MPCTHSDVLIQPPSRHLITTVVPLGTRSRPIRYTTSSRVTCSISVQRTVRAPITPPARTPCSLT
jgi:hypothetical protein